MAPMPIATDAGRARLALFRVFLIAALATAAWQVFRIFAPFLGALASAATIALLVHPLHGRLLRLVRGRRSLAAGLSTLLIVVVLVVPFLVLGWILVREAIDVVPRAQQWAVALTDQGPAALAQLVSPRLLELMERAEATASGWGLELRPLLVQALDAVGAWATVAGGRLLQGLPSALLSAIVVVIGVFFFLRDGTRMVRTTVDLIPMEPVHKEAILRRLDETFGAIVRGMLLTAFAQGVLAGIGFAIAGVPHAPVLGLLTVCLAVVPIVGAAGVWVPCVLFELAVGGGWHAWFLLIWGIFIVSGIDNVIKPLLIKGRTDIPTFLLIFSILGGLSVYGFLGVFFGPLLVGLMLSLAAIYREQYGALVAAVGGPPPARPQRPEPDDEMI
jgi:predicted PurR-regulated permease PerM